MDGKLVDKTNVSWKKKGDKLSSVDFNSVNRTTNDAADAINSQLKAFINVNLEILGNTEEKLSLIRAVRLVPQERRVAGIKVRFLSVDSGRWEEYSYNGANSSGWENEENWLSQSGITEIDGGEFE